MVSTELLENMIYDYGRLMALRGEQATDFTHEGGSVWRETQIKTDQMLELILTEIRKLASNRG